MLKSGITELVSNKIYGHNCSVDQEPPRVLQQLEGCHLKREYNTVAHELAKFAKCKGISPV